MSIQLTRLAILDKESGKQFLSKDGKTRQVYKEKPVTTKIGGGQKVIDGYDHSVSISGLFSKTDKDFLSKLAISEKNVQLSGYTETGMILQGSGKITPDDGGFIISSTGHIGYGSNGDLQASMILSNNMASMKQEGFEAMPIYFPFELDIEASFQAKSGGELSIEALDEDMSLIEETIKEYPAIGRHAFKAQRSLSATLPKGTCYVSVTRKSIIADKLSLTVNL